MKYLNIIKKIEIDSVRKKKKSKINEPRDEFIATRRWHVEPLVNASYKNRYDDDFLRFLEIDDSES